jgi:hypothetical protein
MNELVTVTLVARNGEEPEPIDLTHLNIEASIMCLASKVRQGDHTRHDQSIPLVK